MGSVPGLETGSSNPWRQVLRLISRLEDAHTLMRLFETSNATRRHLVANGVSLEELTRPTLLSSRALAEVLADRMRELTADPGWTEASLLPWTSGIDVSEDELLTFLNRCREQGIHVELGEPWESR